MSSGHQSPSAPSTGHHIVRLLKSFLDQVPGRLIIVDDVYFQDEEQKQNVRIGNIKVVRCLPAAALEETRREVADPFASDSSPQEAGSPDRGESSQCGSQTSIPQKDAAPQASGSECLNPSVTVVDLSAHEEVSLSSRREGTARRGRPYMEKGAPFSVPRSSSRIRTRKATRKGEGTSEQTKDGSPHLAAVQENAVRPREEHEYNIFLKNVSIVQLKSHF